MSRRRRITTTAAAATIAALAGADADENGDRYARVGEALGAAGEPAVTPIPGAINDIKGSHGGTVAVQSLWSNAAAAGTGYGAGAGNDLPSPLPAQ